MNIWLPEIAPREWTGPKVRFWFAIKLSRNQFHLLWIIQGLMEWEMAKRAWVMRWSEGCVCVHLYISWWGPEFLYTPISSLQIITRLSGWLGLMLGLGWEARKRNTDRNPSRIWRAVKLLSFHLYCCWHVCVTLTQTVNTTNFSSL